MSIHDCPRCGAPTAGAYSEGGLRWAICDDCMRADRDYRDDMRRQRGEEYGDAIERDDHRKHRSRR